ncbi:MAG: hypothetical protein ABFD50_07370, partial [Smithella sp.]
METLAAELTGLEDELAPFMGDGTTALNNNINNISIYKENDDNLTTSGEFLTQNRREKDLKNIITSLIKGGFSEKETVKLLELITLSCGDVPNQKWISDCVEKAKSPSTKLERNLAADIKEWVLSSSGA